MTDTPIRSEEELVQDLLAPLAAGFPGAFGLRDDCAVIAPTAGHEIVVKTDPVASGVHFLDDDPPEDIAWKALAVNVSDLAAKGARPIAYLMALSFPQAPARDWMERFASGLGEAQAAFGCHLAGGDTDRRPGPLTVSITVLGEVPAGRMVRRGTAAPGDLLFVSGTLGDAALGLDLLSAPERQRDWGLNEDHVAHLRARYRRPRPRLGLIEPLRKYARAAMDLSDGLAKDLGRMCSASVVAARVQLADIPMSAAVRQALASDPEFIRSVVSGGDDYEVLAAVPPGDAMAFRARAASHGVEVTAIGRVVEGAGLLLSQADGSRLLLARTGYDHF